ncbi:MAG: hypothetical protein MJ041_05750, partial [Acidaminococcaceae bacterium]|nr:hypothetical protein [Acidaminococcaceae bacterium]
QKLVGAEKAEKIIKGTYDKDAVKIPAEFIAAHRTIPLYVLNMEIDVTKGKEAVENLIGDMLDKVEQGVKRKEGRK